MMRENPFPIRDFGKRFIKKMEFNKKRNEERKKFREEENVILGYLISNKTKTIKHIRNHCPDKM